MEGSSSDTTMDAEQHLILALHHVLKAVEARRNLTDDTKRSLGNLVVEFSRLIALNDEEAERTNDVEIKCALEKITNFRPNQFNVWDHSGHQELLDYLEAINEVRTLKESIGIAKGLVDEAQNALQIAMEGLEELLINILSQNKSFYLCEDGFNYEKSLISSECDSVEGGASRRASSSTVTEEMLMDFVHPDIVPCLKSIADVMFSSGYSHEFCRSFICFRRNSLDEYLKLMNMEQFSTEDVLKMEWGWLSSNIKKWCKATRSLFGFYLVSEKRFFDQVIGDLGDGSSTCFVEATMGSVLGLLNFGHAVVIGHPLRPERLFSLLDMYELLAYHLECVNELYTDNGGSVIRMEFESLLAKSGRSGKIIFLEFGNLVASDSSVVHSANGRIPHLTKYVMNYITLLEEYIDTLNLLLQEEDPGSVLKSLASILEARLEESSKSFADQSLKQIFMMNNIHYMVQKIRNSKIKVYFGDEWIKEHIVKFQQHARSYERVTWSSVLTFLRDDGTKSKSILKERCRDFSAAFEEIYRVQRRWHVPDHELREDLRLQTIQHVIHPYRAFLSRMISACVCERNIKYSVEQLENHILDLFENPRRS